MLKVDEYVVIENLSKVDGKSPPKISPQKPTHRSDKTSAAAAQRANSLPPGTQPPTTPHAPVVTSQSKGQSSKSQTLPSRFRDARLTRIRRAIRGEIEAAFSDYELPVEKGTTSASRTETDDVIMAGVGVQTMTKLMREEILRYKAQMELAPSGSAPPTPAGGSPLVTRTASPVYEVDNEIYEDPYMTLDQFALAPPPPGISSNNSPHISASSPKTSAKNTPSQATPPLYAKTHKTFDPPPPLPPRNKPTNVDDSWDMTALAETLRQPVLADDSSLNTAISGLAQILEAAQWKKLARVLPLTSDARLVERRVREIERDFLGNTEKQALVMLIEWRINNKRSADVTTLRSALKKIGLSQAREFVKTSPC